MAGRPRKRAAIAVSRKARRLFRASGQRPDAAEALTALARAWMVTMIATALLAAALGLAGIWDTTIYLRALRDTLNGESTLVRPVEVAPANAAIDPEIRPAP